MMKYYLFTALAILLSLTTSSQDAPIEPTIIGEGTLLGVTPPLRDLPVMTAADYLNLEEKLKENGELNERLNQRSYPFQSIALPRGEDLLWQKTGSVAKSPLAPIVNFDGQNSPAFPPDCNGTVGPNHYMQTVNSTYAIYDKSGSLVAGPTNMNQLFSGVPGANCNDGDPLVLYDDMADRWLAVEFSLCGSTDMMLVAVSATDDPTGSWYKYSFDVADMPDYEKFGIWPDGYYMGTNNSSGNDIYVFERSVMLTGGTGPKMIGFNNAWRPSSIDGFMCVPPVDNDGPEAPAGSPGLFIAFNDDAIGGGSDELWIYELTANWTTPSASSFNRTQQLAVAAFDSNFGNNWDNIKQSGTNQELDGIPQVIMHVPQYRNFGSYQTLVCCHTVDVDNTDHAGLRWYELRRTSGNWSLRQQGTFAPDIHSRWMGSIMMNASNELGLGYSVSSSSMFPSIRYCGQTIDNYQNATGILDFPEGSLLEGSFSQTSFNRWGDYALTSVDPVDDETFWFTTQYIGNGGARKTRIGSFQVGVVVPVTNFAASNTLPCLNTDVSFNDLSSGNPVSWHWEFTPSTVAFVDGTDSTSQNPHVRFLEYGNYSVALTASNPGGSNTLTRTGYIAVNAVNDDFSASSTTVVAGYSTLFTDLSSCNVGSWSWNFGEGATPSTASTAGPHLVTYNSTGLKTVSLIINDTVIQTKTGYINVIDPVINMSNATVSTCSGNFYDPGGSSSNYLNSQDLTMVLNPGVPGNAVQVVFTSFNVQAGMFCANDYLKILNGNSLSSPVVGVFCGSVGPDTVTADNVTGSLTFIFHSNGQLNFPGWSAIINCIEGVANPMTMDATAISESQIDLQWTPNPSNDQVMLLWSPDGIFGIPANGNSYSAGELIPGGGIVLFAGNGNSFSHTGLEPQTQYFYKAYSSNSANLWSSGISSNATTLGTSVLTITPSQQTVTHEPGSVSFDVISNEAWTTSTDVTWCSATPAGFGNGTIVASYDENTGPVVRAANISVQVSGLAPQDIQLLQLPSFLSLPDKLSGEISIFPNPSNGLFTLSSHDRKILNIELTMLDEKGRVVFMKSYSGSASYLVDISNMPAGLYYVKAGVDSKNQNWKLMKK